MRAFIYETNGSKTVTVLECGTQLINTTPLADANTVVREYVRSIQRRVSKISYMRSLLTCYCARMPLFYKEDASCTYCIDQRQIESLNEGIEFCMSKEKAVGS